MRGSNIRIVLQVVDVIEAVGGDQLGDRGRLAAFLRAVVQEVLERIDMRRRDIRIGLSVMLSG